MLNRYVVHLKHIILHVKKKERHIRGLKVGRNMAYYKKEKCQPSGEGVCVGVREMRMGSGLKKGPIV